MTLTSLLFLLVVIVQDARAFKPDRHYSTTPREMGLQYDSVNVFTQDEYRLTGWLCRPNGDAVATIIVAGGDAGNMSHNLGLASILVSAMQVEVLLFDYRGFGSSSDFPIDSNLIAYPEHFADLRTVVDWAKKGSPAKRLIVFGRSMGASLALGVTDDTLLHGVIAESPYTSQADLTEFVNAKQKNKGSSRRVSFIPNERLDPLASISNCKIPVALIGGELEQALGPFDLRKLYNLVQPDVRRWLLIEGGAGHLELVNKSPYGVAAIVNSVLETKP